MAETSPTLPRAQTPFARLAGEFLESKVAVLGLAVLVLLIAAALLAPWITPQNPYDLMQVDILDSMIPPGGLSDTGQLYLLGTDDQGRDMLSAIIFGLRTSLGVGVASALIALVLGTALGLVAAFAGGRVDTVIMRTVDIQVSFPATLIALMLLAIFGRGVDKIIIALVAVQWAYYARTVRASALVEQRKEYIEAARCLGLPARRVVFRHLLVNCMPPLIVVLTVQVASAITLEATLSFLGLGLPVTQPSLGLLISNGFDYLLAGRFWISLFPGIALVVAIVSINLVADRLRDMLNPRLQR